MAGGCLPHACLAAGASAPVSWESARAADSCRPNHSKRKLCTLDPGVIGEAFGRFHGVGPRRHVEGNPGPPCGGRAASLCESPALRKPNCGLPSTPIRGWTVKGSRVPRSSNRKGDRQYTATAFHKMLRSRFMPRASQFRAPPLRRIFLFGTTMAAVPLAAVPGVGTRLGSCSLLACCAHATSLLTPTMMVILQTQAVQVEECTCKCKQI